MKQKILDIDRLHKVHLGVLSGRRCGKTVLFITDLIGLSELEDYKLKRFYILFNYQKDILNTLSSVEEVCEMLNIRYKISKVKVPYKSNELEVKINETTFQFCINIIENRRGRSNIIFEEKFL